jgi:L-iditol 2-dehydrogenase
MEWFQADDRVAVLGMGPIGLMMACLLKQLGARLIVMTGRSPQKKRINIALDMGVDRVVDIHQEDPVMITREATERIGLDIVFEATGNSSVLSQGLDMTRTGGEVILCGIFEKEGKIRLTDFVRGRKRLVGSHTYDDSTWIKVVELLSKGTIPINKLITHVLPLAEGVRAFDLAIRREGIKILVKP